MTRKTGARIIAVLLMYFMAGAAHSGNAATAPQNPWQQTAALLSPRSGAGVIEVDGVIYAVGGIDGSPTAAPYRQLPHVDSAAAGSAP